jgi:single-strand DNA-binding protein
LNFKTKRNMAVNKVILVGNVGKDPETRYLDENTPVCKFPLATSETYKNRDGERIEQTEWHNIVLWRGLAKVAEQYVKKGSQLYIEGRIRTRSYDDKDGIKRYTTEIVGDNMQMLGRRQDGDQRDDGYGSTARPGQRARAGQRVQAVMALPVPAELVHLAELAQAVLVLVQADQQAFSRAVLQNRAATGIHPFHMIRERMIPILAVRAKRRTTCRSSSTNHLPGFGNANNPILANGVSTVHNPTGYPADCGGDTTGVLGPGIRVRTGLFFPHP